MTSAPPPAPQDPAAIPAAAGSGYDPAFLGVPVPLPAAAGRPTRVLPSTHFSVVMDLQRRLAAVTAVNIDGAALRDLDRAGIDWELDPRLPADQQAGPELYRDNDLDRGHLVRRRDPVWGGAAEAARANAETFRYTNAAPQAADFNQGKELWLGLEDQLLGTAESGGRRLSVFTGPVLAPADPLYRGIRIPLRFFKVAVVAVDTVDGADTVDTADTVAPSPGVTVAGLASAGYLLDQSELVDLAEPGSVRSRADGPPLGAYRTFQVPVADIAALTGLDFGALSEVDVLAPVGAGVREVDPSRWVPLTGPQDVILPG
ncbi:DNA/RNA non-specific endonuclease [Nakamurella flavida]|uniref:DNA/RNA non-specific endonuclease n=1 Tax=Nakamurella flavida TaxID=363630 RepID=A0A938YCN9_9ACTN|nr:DNA/RNA non-specific endonuclease [Nakamurella flavida]MBM9475221.1 DNA/RNA non-specific endonuclease [Nakamurella flavida]MDP9776794.1 endonuclease G [Nakamurella flavida]